MVNNSENLRIIRDVPFTLEPERLMRKMGGLRASARLDARLEALLAQAGEVAHPKVVFRAARVGRVDATSVYVDETRFEGSLLLVNFKTGMQVYPFVATCGRELDGVQVDYRDISGKFILETIKTALLMSAIEYVRAQICRESQIKQLSAVNPGELESWPLEQQRPLFSLLGDVESATGVTLTPSLGMIPLKSRSGIFFPSESGFENCHFCARARCVGRRAAYDPSLAAALKSKAKGICG